MTRHQVSALNKLTELARQHAALQSQFESGPPEAIATPSQIQLGRKLVGWSRERLGAMSNTSAHVVRAYEESGQLVGSITGLSGEERLATIRAALEAAGLIFT